MSDELAKLRQELAAYKKATDKRLDEQDKTIKKLEKALADEKSKLITYINNLMHKADRLIQGLRRTQVIDRQRMNDLDNEVSRLSRKGK